ncbi:MAG: aminoacyl-tRNA hydrolase [Gammaproteobacteria bacterium RIFCSPHIGHO2_12_FULL_37_14]|nr:MAG: aminoacyl-tRNA hydrolase [Gammaproteobacteria bacterium RIFCSPHIGHO2_12_FULL_37_14]
MTSPIQLIVGLANPGKEYAETRHNAGAWFVENIAKGSGTTLRLETKCHGLHGLAHFSNHICHLLIPSTFMNRSGQAVQACAHYHKIIPESILIVHDDIDLPVGSIKLKFDGGDGGHNGLKDIISHLNTKQFYRLRIGIGHPGNSKDVEEYVLNKPSKSDQQSIRQVLLQAEDILPLLFSGEISKAMQTLHTVTKDI